eukprot:TRINITY_DN4583_c0_g1_i1.p1 TRINITY_DN4583_c0_g1~~TRINITY_DN4583_c0_g1_i1.p1  ORF type:complete len:306 (-),score=62.45 TRINITY_DN4583_c0_g1_i1:196-1113(-)
MADNTIEVVDFPIELVDLQFKLPSGQRLRVSCGRETNSVSELKANLSQTHFDDIGDPSNILLYDNHWNLMNDTAPLAEFALHDESSANGFLKLRRYNSYADSIKSRIVKGLNTTRGSFLYKALFDVLSVIVMSLFIAASAQISFYFPWDNKVPFTMQTFAVLFTGTILGSIRGFSACTLYVLMGIAGAPFFSDQSSGVKSLAGSTGGYLLGMIFAGALVGFLSEKGFVHRWRSTVLAMVAGNVVIYIFGVGWLAIFLHNFKNAFIFGCLPFLIGDAIKVILASALLPIGWKVMAFRSRRRVEREE